LGAPLLVDDRDPRFGGVDIGFGRLNARCGRGGFRLRSLGLVASSGCRGLESRCPRARRFGLTTGIGQRALGLGDRERRRGDFGTGLRKNQRRAENGADADRG